MPGAQGFAEDSGQHVLVAQQGTWTVGLNALSGSAVGQALMAASLPVAIASNQSAIPASQSGTWTVAQGTAAGAAGPWPIAVSDGVHVINVGDNATSAVKVNIVAGASGLTFSVADETAWTAGTSNMVPMGAVFNDTATALTAGQEGTLRGTANRALHVNLRDASANQLLGSKTSANSIPVVIASDQAAILASQSGTWTVATNADVAPAAAVPAKGLIVGGSDGVDFRFLLTDNTGILKTSIQNATLAVTESGTWNVGLSAGTNLVGAVSPGASATVGTGLSIFSNTSLTNTATAIKASAGKLMWVRIYHTNTADSFLQVYNVAAAGVTVGTTGPTEVFPVPAGTSATKGGFYDIAYTDLGNAYGTAISCAFTTTATGGSAPASNAIVHAGYI